MPETFLIAAMSLCGQISPLPFKSQEDRRLLERWRDKTDASLMGAGTLRKADPEMRGSYGLLRKERIRAFVTASGQIPLQGKKAFLYPPSPLIFTGKKEIEGLKKRAGKKARLIALPYLDKGLDLKAALKHLKDLKVSSLLIEGGGILNYQALKQGIVDEVLLTIFPVIYNNPEASPFININSTCMDKAESTFKKQKNWQLISYKKGEKGEVFLHYKIRS